MKNFDAEKVLPHSKLLKYASRSDSFALAAAAEAFADAGIQPDDSTGEKWGLSVGAGMMSVSYDDLKEVQKYAAPEGHLEPDGLLNDEYPDDPVSFCRWQSNSCTGLLTRQFGIRGYATSVHTACASGGQAIGTALESDAARAM